MTGQAQLSRRSFMAGAVHDDGPPPPPWTDEARLRDACTGCGACIAACPEAILVRGRAGTPRVDVARGACTFCGACAAACEDAVFDLDRDPPWSLGAVLDAAACWLTAGIACQVCTDFCDARALRLDLGVRPVGAIRVDTDACTGCGACVAACPADAIALRPAPAEAAA